jgi:hypothetical protein
MGRPPKENMRLAFPSKQILRYAALTDSYIRSKPDGGIIAATSRYVMHTGPNFSLIFRTDEDAPAHSASNQIRGVGVSYSWRCNAPSAARNAGVMKGLFDT